jgi:molybdate transport system ATP-binding protein
VSGLSKDEASEFRKEKVGFIFQSFNLIPVLTAYENIEFSLDLMKKYGAKEKREKVESIMKEMGILELKNRRPAEMSGGQQQRVAVARALARRPQALLLDEPFSAVDRATREKLYGEIIDLRASLAMPVVLVTHDMNEAQLLADRMAVIEKGRVVQTGTTAEVMADPDALRAMGIREVAAMLPAVVVEHGADGLTRLDAPTGALFLPGVEGAPGMRVRVRIMAHDVILSRRHPEGLSAQNIIAGKVARVMPGAGPGVMVHIDVAGHEILARITRRAAEQMALAPGDAIHAILKSMSVARDHVAPAPTKGRGTD